MARKFELPRAVERRYATELRRVARIVGGLVQSHVDGSTIRDPRKLAQALLDYSEALGPWAERLAAKMIRESSAANFTSFTSQSKAIGASLKSMLSDTAIGQTARMLQNRQVELIKSLPLEAGLRAQELAQQAVIGGKRADVVAAELARTEEVTLNRATLIARTEAAKANAAITQARAEFIGATHYIWRTAEDADVRESHAVMEGVVCEFANPPAIEGEGNHGPGEIYNCRCYAEPIIPEPK